MSVTNVLDVKDLTVNYDNLPAVDNISFDVKQGDCLGIVGPNGAGKTTSVSYTHLTLPTTPYV